MLALRTAAVPYARVQDGFSMSGVRQPSEGMLADHRACRTRPSGWPLNDCSNASRTRPTDASDQSSGSVFMSPRSTEPSTSATRHSSRRLRTTTDATSSRGPTIWTRRRPLRQRREAARVPRTARLGSVGGLDLDEQKAILRSEVAQVRPSCAARRPSVRRAPRRSRLARHTPDDAEVDGPDEHLGSDDKLGMSGAPSTGGSAPACSRRIGSVRPR
jgi:hypothetical protein